MKSQYKHHKIPIKVKVSEACIQYLKPHFNMNYNCFWICATNNFAANKLQIYSSKLRLCLEFCNIDLQLKNFFFSAVENMKTTIKIDLKLLERIKTQELQLGALLHSSRH